jgi:deoxycytidylate deaminase
LPRRARSRGHDEAEGSPEPVPTRSPTDRRLNADEYPPVGRAELVVGLVYGAGVEADPIQERLRLAFQEFAYDLEPIHLSKSFPGILSRDHIDESPNKTRSLQDMGDDLREAGGKGITGLLAAFLIAGRRRARARSEGDDRVVWLVRSLRRPEEVKVLREIYGPRFVLIGVYAPESLRLRNLTSRRRRHAATTTGRFEPDAVEDLKRDHNDLEKAFGQSMSKTFPLSDFFLDGRAPHIVEHAVERMARIMFGDTFVSPTRDEQAMFLAHSAAHRSVEMGRQVGAALVDSWGDIVATGTNEVPSGGGGLYWYPDTPDGRDFAQEVPVDSNTDWKRRVARELIDRLVKGVGPKISAESTVGPDESAPAAPDEPVPWLAPERIARLVENDEVSDVQLRTFLDLIDGTRLADLIEFGRAVHAEMDAVLSAARRGVVVRDTTLACTDSPCHNCMRHLLAAGVRRVIYIAPYAKSLAVELHGEAIVFEPEDEESARERKLVLDQFVGVAPRGFAQYFDFTQIKRKDDLTGVAKGLEERHKLLPRVLRDNDAWSFGGPTLGAEYVAALEQRANSELVRKLEAKNLTVPSE